MLVVSNNAGSTWTCIQRVAKIFDFLSNILKGIILFDGFKMDFHLATWHSSG